MSQFIELLQPNLIEIVTTVAIAILSFLGLKIKKLIEGIIIDETKRKCVKSVVNAVNKLYRDLGGAEKLIKAQENIEEMLKEKGITITELEMRILIEEVCNLKENREEEDLCNI